MRQKPDKSSWLKHHIACVVHPAVCSFRENMDHPVRNRAKQNCTEFRRGTLGREIGFYQLRRWLPFSDCFLSWVIRIATAGGTSCKQRGTGSAVAVAGRPSGFRGWAIPGHPTVVPGLLPHSPCGCHPLLPAPLIWKDLTIQRWKAEQWTRALPLVQSWWQNSFGTSSEVLNKHLEIQMPQPIPMETSGSKIKSRFALICKLWVQKGI